MLYLQFFFLSKFKLTNVLNGAVLSRDIFSFELVAYQPLQCYQISWAIKDKVEKANILVQCSWVEKF